jgi:ribokinase
MLASLGVDADGDSLLAVLESSGVDATLVRRTSAHSGMAVVTVGRDSDNAISIIAGANDRFTRLTAKEAAALSTASCVLLQLEMPMPLVVAAAALGRLGGALIILTPAPVVPLADDLLKSVDILVANRHEALLIAGADNLEDALESLVLSVPIAVITDGSRGCRWATVDGERGSMRAPTVDAIDTTGAGDTFAGYLAVGLSQGGDLKASITRATTAASIAVQRPGGSPAIPTAREVDNQ